MSKLNHDESVQGLVKVLMDIFIEAQEMARKGGCPSCTGISFMASAAAYLTMHIAPEERDAFKVTLLQMIDKGFETAEALTVIDNNGESHPSDKIPLLLALSDNKSLH
jgi:hypothetical protein